MAYTEIDPAFSTASAPFCVKFIVIIIGFASLFATLFDRWFVYFFKFSITQEVFSLSWTGLTSGYFWQLFTYWMIDPASGTIDFSFLFNLAFKCYIILITGSAICERYKENLFAILTTGATLLSALTLLPYLAINAPQLHVSGFTALFFSLVLFWSMLNRETMILLFFAIPLRIQWLLAFFMGGITLICINNGDWASFSMALFGSLWAYLWATLIYGLRTPFPWTWKIDERLQRLGSSFAPSVKSWIGSSKIIKMKQKK